MALLATHGVTKRFGGLVAVDDVSLEVQEGQIYSVIGPNGAGKTTFFNCLTGIGPATEGDVEFEGRAITTLPPHRVCRLGMARTFQNIRLFKAMTAAENVIVGHDVRCRTGLWGAIFPSPRRRREERESSARALELLDFVGLRDAANAVAHNLPYGAQRRLEIARAMATEPSLLLLDEPAAGMNPRETGELMDLIRAIRDHGMTVLLIEHHMKLVMGISDWIAVLDYGVKIAEGTADDVRDDPRVIEAYLGSEEHD